MHVHHKMYSVYKWILLDEFGVVIRA